MRATEKRLRFEDCSPVFVVGASRSGTTLLQLILNAHPRLSICGELHYYDQIRRLQSIVPTLGTADARQKFRTEIKRLADYDKLVNIEMVLDLALARIADTGRGDYDALYWALMREYASLEGKARIGEKTTENVRYLHELRSLFPHARVVHIVRDPRDAVASLVRMEQNTPDVLIHSLTWRCDVYAGLSFGTLSGDNYHEIAYEQLVREPEEVVRSVCSFIGEPFDPQMLRFHETAGQYIKNEPWKARTKQPINDDSVGRWRESLTAAEARIVEACVGKVMESAGYRREVTGPFVGVRALARLPYEAGQYLTAKLKRWMRQDSDVIGTSKFPLIALLTKSLVRSY